jgi:glycerol-3-phosphate dehydrogenase subunit B
MESKRDDICCNLAVIGAGMAGMASALFAANRGLSVVQVGTAGESIFASGLLDLLGVHPIEKKRVWENPWEGIEALVCDIPKHPYAFLKRGDIALAFEELTAFLHSADIDYCQKPGANIKVLTPIGTSKPTYCVPKTMWAGVEALEASTSCLLVDFEGFNEFSAVQIAATLGNRWPEIQTVRLPFPSLPGTKKLYPERMALALEAPRNRELLARTLQPHLKNMEIVGIPAVLGIFKAKEVHAHLEEMIGAPLFEIPTLPVSIPGIRLREVFLKRFPERGVRSFFQSEVVNAEREANGDFLLTIRDAHMDTRVRTKGVILATGRFLGKGLSADRTRIRETVFNLPVYQPASRDKWHRQEFLDPRGHPIHRAGLETDSSFRPLDLSGAPAFNNLFSVGSILAHQDWIRMKCGSGLAISTAYKAVNAFINS